MLTFSRRSSVVERRTSFPVCLLIQGWEATEAFQEGIGGCMTFSSPANSFLQIP